MSNEGKEPVTSQPGQQSGPPPSYGQPGQPQYGQPGQPQYGQPGLPQYGQPGQPPYGQPGQPQYGQPGQPPYGQPQYGQPGYGPPPPGPYGQPGQPMPGQPGMPPGGQIAWMNRPEPISGCPPGLEYLTQIDQLLVKQQVELFELFTSWETKNRYIVANSVGQQVYFASEESDTCQRQCCGPARGFIMHITDNLGQEVIRVTREFKCCAGCAWCASTDHCAFIVSVEAPPGQVVGYVRQQCSPWTPKYSILDAAGDLLLNMKGPCCICQGVCCAWDQDFNIFSPDWASNVGKVSKQWTGVFREMFTDADNFGVSFPQDLDVKVKATLLGAVFLIDFMYFEQKQNNNN